MSSNTHTHNKSGLKTLKAYAIGLVLSLLLTFVSFGFAWMHMDPTPSSHLLTSGGLFFVLVVLALVQLFVQVTCFLRLNASREGRWELMPFLFVIFVVIVIVGGSVWIMYNLNYNMMN